MNWGRRIDKKWGYEEIPINTPDYCLKRLTVEPNGFACSVHYHLLKKETFLVLSGTLMLQVYVPKPEVNLPRIADLDRTFALSMFLPPKLLRLTEGEQITIERLTPHRFWAWTETRFLEVSTHDCPTDSIRIVESGPIPNDV